MFSSERTSETASHSWENLSFSDLQGMNALRVLCKTLNFIYTHTHIYIYIYVCVCVCVN